MRPASSSTLTKGDLIVDRLPVRRSSVDADPFGAPCANADPRRLSGLPGVGHAALDRCRQCLHVSRVEQSAWVEERLNRNRPSVRMRGRDQHALRGDACTTVNDTPDVAHEPRVERQQIDSHESECPAIVFDDAGPYIQSRRARRSRCPGAPQSQRAGRRGEA